MNTLLAKQLPDRSEVMDRIVRTYHPLKIILIGSWARGSARDDGNRDLLVVLPKVEHNEKRQS